MKTGISPIRRVRWRQRAWLVLASVATAACAAPFAPLPSPRPLGQDLDAVSPARLEHGPPREPVQEPEGALTLSLALAAALRASPALESSAWQVRADEARALQAGLLPNPALLVEGENLAGSGAFSAYDAAETTVFLGQLVQLGGKRTKRERVAMLERELSGWDYEAARMDVLTETTRRFVAVLAATRRLELTRDILRVAGESLQATRARVRAGAASAVEEARSRVVVATLDVELTRRELELEAARKRLATSWGGTAPRFTEVVGDLSALRELPSLERISRALAENPDLARWATESAKRDAALELARAQAIPDVTAGLGIRHFQETDDAALVFGVEVPLPLFDRNQGGREAARAGTHRARSQAHAARLELTRALVATHAEASSAYQNARALERNVLPQARDAYEGTEDGYRRGLFRLVDVLDAQRTLFEVRSEYVNALERFHTASAELERLAGAPLESLSGRNP